MNKSMEVDDDVRSQLVTAPLLVCEGGLPHRHDDPCWESSLQSSADLIAAARSHQTTEDLALMVEKLRKNVETLQTINSGINYSGVLCRAWSRHQYLKVLGPIIFAAWYLGILLLCYDYSIKAKDFINNQLNEFNCTTTESHEVNFPNSCHSGHYYSCRGLETIDHAVTCKTSGVDLQYNETFLEVYGQNYYLQLFLNFVGPLIITYYVVELGYLAMYDALVLVPAVDNRGKCVIWESRRAKRVGLLFLYDIMAYFGWRCPETELSEIEKPGIRLDLTHLMEIQVVYFAILFSYIFAGIDADIVRCTNSGRSAIFIALLSILLGSICCIVSIYRLHHLLKIPNLEKLASSYSTFFSKLRFPKDKAGSRNIIDCFALVFASIFVIPFYFVYVVDSIRVNLGLPLRKTTSYYERLFVRDIELESVHKDKYYIID